MWGIVCIGALIVCLKLGKVGIWILGAACVAAVILPPKWNPAFWHRVHPGTGEIRKGDGQ